MRNLFYILIAVSLFHNFAFGQWIQQNSGTTGDLNSVYFVNSLTGWICGVTGPASTDRIAKTTDGGITWVRQNAGTYYLMNSIQFINEQTGWAAGIHGTIVKTTNGGTNWYVVFGSTSWDWNDMQFIDSQTGWVAGGSNGIYKTTDGGLNWIYYFNQNIFNDIHFCNDLSGWGVKLGLNSEISKTTNSGMNWSNQTVNNIALSSCYFLDQVTGWVGGAIDSVPETGKILKTTNSGLNWMIINLDTNTYPKSLHFVNLNKGWFCGASKLFITTNGGNNWIRQITNVQYELKDIFFTDSLSGWSVGAAGTVLRTTNGGGPVGINKISSNIPVTFSLFQNYPNPFNPSTKIKFNIAKSSLVKIYVYDIIGKEISVLVNEHINPGTYEVEWNGSGNSSGIYFYKLETEYYSDTKKLVLIK